MAHFAKVENNVVTKVLHVPDAHESDGQGYLNSIGLDGEWVQTSYNNNIRGVYAGIGYAYDRERDAFVPPQPYPSWTFDEAQWGWVAPIAMPTEGSYEWEEASTSWVAV